MMNNRISRRALGAGAIASGLLASAPPGFTQTTPRRGGTLTSTWGGPEPQACYVPTGGGYGPTFTSAKLLERLAKRNMDGSFSGMLAESWKPSPDFKSYTIAMRRGVVWHDGKPMTVDDVVYSIGELWTKYAIAPALHDLTGAEATDDATIVVSFSKPMPEPYFGAIITGAISYIVPKHVYAGADVMTNPANNSPIGTGPWKFKQWVRGSHFEFVRHDAYWRKELPYLDRLIIRYLRDPASRAAAMEAGEIQLGVGNPVAQSDIKRLIATGKLVATSRGYEENIRSTTLECNVRHPILAKRDVRQAIFQAIDRAWIARTVYYGYARPGTGPIYSSNIAFFTNDTMRLDFDPKAATAMLDTAGYPKKADGKRFTANLVAGGWATDLGKVGAYVKQALEDIGIAVNLVVPDMPTSLKRIYTDYDFDIAISGQANPSEPIPWTTRYFTTDGIRKGLPFYNATGYSSPELDALVEQIRVETEPTKRKALIVEFQKFTAREAVLLPLVEVDSTSLASLAVRNYDTEPNVLAAGWGDLWLAS